MTVMLAAALAWPALAVTLGFLGGRLLRRADRRGPGRTAQPAAAAPRARLARRGHALASSGSRR